MSVNYWNEAYRDGALSSDYDGWLDKYPFSAGEQVLDLGCGGGTNLPFLLGRGACVTAADLSENAVRLVRQGFGNRISADCFDMARGFPYPDEAFHAVVADLSLHYFSWEDTERIAAGLFRILKPGGRLIARVHSMENLPEDAEYISPGYYRAYGCDRRYFTLEDVHALFGAWKLRCAAGTARRYGREKKIIEIYAEKE